MNNTTIKVGPLTGIDFSKIRSFRHGAKIPKYQSPAGTLPLPDWYDSIYNQKQLLNWNSSLDSSYWGNSNNESVHGNAGNLETAYNLMALYEAGVNGQNKIGADIQSAYNTFGGLKSAQDFVTAYNANIDKLNNFYGEGTTHTYNDLDALEFNQLYKTMYNSRSSETGDIGYNDELERYMGSQTWLRRVDRYEKEFDQLTPEEKAARTYTIKIGNKDVKVYKKADGKIGLFPDPDIPPTPPLEDPKDKIPPETDKRDGITPVEFPSGIKPQVKPWTDWMHLAAIRGMNERAINKEYDLLNQQRTPLLMPTELYVKTASDYATREANAKAANAVVANAARNATANQDYNNQVMNQAYAAETNVLDLNASILQNRINLTVAALNLVADQNTANRVATANTNNQNLIAGQNQRLINEVKRTAELNSNDTDYLNKVDASHNQYVANARNLIIQQVADENKARYTKWITDNYYNPYKELINAGGSAYIDKLATEYMSNPSAYLLTDEENRALSGKTSSEVAEYIKNNPNSTLGKLAAKQYADAVNAAETKYLDAQQKGQLYMNDLKNAFNTTITGEGLLNLKVDNSALFDPNAAALQFKLGGRFLEYLDHNRKVRKDVNERVNSESNRQVRLLQTQLNALNLQTIALLRSIFK